MALQMSFSGAPDVRADRGTVWRHLVDPAFVAHSAPGAKMVRETGPGRYGIDATIGMGPMKLDLTIELEIADRVEPTSARLVASAGAHGSSVRAESSVRLDESAAGRTTIHWNATTTIDGAITNFGPKLVETVARKLTSEFWDDFARRVETAA